MTEEAAAPELRRRGVARRLARAAVSLFGTILLLVCVALVGLQTGPAKRRIAQEIEAAVASGGGPKLTIGSIEGFLPFNLVIRDAKVSDAAGPIAEIGRLRASLLANALFDRRVVLTGLDLSGVVLHRLPASGPDDGEPVALPVLPSLPVSITVARLNLVGARIAKPVLGRAVVLDMTGAATLEADGRSARLSMAAHWDGGAGSATLSGAYLPAAGRLSVDAALKEKKNGLLPALAGLPDRPAYQVGLTGAGSLKTWTARLKAAVSDTALVPAELVPLTGRDIVLGGEVRIDKTGALQLRGFEASAGKVTVKATGALRDGMKVVDVKASYRIADLAPLSAVAGTGLGGSLAGTATVSGTVAQPKVAIAFAADRLAVADIRPELLKGTVTLTGLPQDIAGRFAVEARARGVSARLASGFSLMGASVLKLREIDAAAGGLSVGGQLDVALNSGTAVGALQLKAPDIAEAARLAQIEAKGALTAKITLRAENGRQGLALDGRMTGLSVKQDGRTFSVATATLTGRTPDVLAAPQGAFALNAQGLRAKGLTLSRLKLAIEGALKQGKYALETAGNAGKPFQAASTGTYALSGDAASGGTATLRLATLRGQFGDLPIVAAGPFTLTRKGEALTLTPVTLRVDGHPITARAAIAAKAVDVRAQFRAVPAAMLRHVPGAPALKGTLSASLAVSGPAAAPRAEFSFEGRGLGTAGTVKGKVPTLDVTGSGKIGGGALTFASRITGIGSAPFTAEGSLPFALSFAPFKADLPADRTISAKLRGTTELAALQAILPIGESRIRGRGQVALDVGGTLAAPHLTGTASITGGRYESITTGLILDAVELRAQGDGNSVRIQKLAATDGSGGKLSGNGQVNFIGGQVGAIDASVELTQFRVVRLDQATVQASGRTRLTGTAIRPSVTGELTVNKAELNIAKKFAASLETIDVVVIGRDGKRRVIKRSATGPRKREALQVALDLKVNVPGKAFVRGRGLDSEWKGQLKVTGTTAEPSINGKLEVVRGQIALLGKRFQIKSGTVAFAGNAISNPDIDFLAEAKATNLTAQVRATGTAEKPVFTISSDPALPRDEVLSRLLFNKEAGKLTALQAVQLANAAAELSGEGTGGLTDRLRTAAGLSTLDFDGGEKGKSGPSVRVGKYVSDRIYLSVEQGKTLDSSKVGVTIEITPNVSVESKTDQSGDSDIGIIYRYDY